MAHNGNMAKFIVRTLLAALLPTAMGMALCTAFTALARALGW